MAQAKSSSLWERAMSQTKTHEQWKKFEKILDREPALAATVQRQPAPGSTSPPSALNMNRPDDIAAIVDKSREISQKIKHPKAKALYDVCNTVLNGIIATNELGIALTRLNPHASMAWGIVQFIAKTASNDLTVREMCWKHLPDVTLLASRYQTFEGVLIGKDSVLTSKQSMEDVMVKFYSSILNYQVSVVIQIYSKRARIKAILGGAAASQPQSFLADIKQDEESLLKFHGIVSREVDLSRFKAMKSALLEVENEILKVDDNLASVKKSMEYSRRNEIIEWISPIKYDATHLKSSKTALAGTGDWFLENREYLKWLNCAKDSTLWLHGFMGSGKSCLVHAVIQGLKVEISNDPTCSTKLLYFYCDGTDNNARKQLNDAAIIVRCLLKELADTEPAQAFDVGIDKFYDKWRHKAELPLPDCVELISQLINQYSSTIIIVDGLDECPRDVQASLLAALQSIADMATMPVKIMIASRYETWIQELLTNRSDFIINIADYNSKDVSMLIQERVSSAAQSPGTRSLYVRGRENQSAAVIEALQKNAGGMFRWVDLALGRLHSSKTFREMKIRMGNLGELQDLFRLYDKIYEEFLESASEESQCMVRTALQMLLYGQSWKEFSRRNQDLFPKFKDVKKSKGRRNKRDESEVLDPKNDRNRHILEASTLAATGAVQNCCSASELLALCPAFICLSEIRGAVYPVLTVPHFSVREYLSKKQANHFSPDNAHIQLACLCITTFTEPDEFYVDTELNSEWVQYAATHWITHIDVLRMSGKYSRSLEEIFRANTGLAQCLHDFLFYDWVTQGFANWHAIGSQLSYGYDEVCTALWFVSEPASSILARIYLDHQWKDESCLSTLPNLSCTGMRQIWSAEQYQPSIMDYAVILSAMPVVSFLLTHGFNINQKNATEHTLGHACFIATTRLKSHSYFVHRASYLTSPGPNPAWLPHRQSTYKMLSLLIGLGYEVDASARRSSLPVNESTMYEFKYFDHDLLIFQVSKVHNFDFQSTELLIRNGLDPTTSRGRAGEDLLSAALAWRNEEAIRFLLPDFLKCETPELLQNWLASAIIGRHSKRVSLFLEHGADPMKTTHGLFGLTSPLIHIALDLGCVDGKEGGLIFDLLTQHCVKHHNDSFRKYDSISVAIRKDSDAIITYCQLDTIKTWTESNRLPVLPHYDWLGNRVTATEIARAIGRDDVVEYFEQVLREKPDCSELEAMDDDE